MNNPQPSTPGSKLMFGLSVVILIAAVAYVAWSKTHDDIDVVNPPDNGGPTDTPDNDTDNPGDSSFKTFTDPKTGASFQYPAALGTQYISSVDWPPQLQVLDQAYSCTAGGSETAQAGVTAEQTIQGHTYCVTKESEGAAGSVYTNYAYAFPFGDKTAILTFSLRLVQCANYDEPQQTACTAERTAFDIDPTIDRIANTLTAR